jgi:hypothetical protein
LKPWSELSRYGTGSVSSGRPSTSSTSGIGIGGGGGGGGGGSGVNNEAVTGIVYSYKRSDCDSLAGYLKSQKVDAAPYHAGLNKERRTQVLADWSCGKIKVVVVGGRFSNARWFFGIWWGCGSHFALLARQP